MDTTTTAAKAYRVACLEHAVEARDLGTAERLQARIEKLAACGNWHYIEVRVGDEWLPLHIAQAREILAAKLGTRFDYGDGPLVLQTAGWSKEAAERASAAATVGTPEWLEALGTHDDALLTADGQGVDRSWFCGCEPSPSADTWVRYEAWTAEGRVAHGYACRTCRRITQTG